jgi:uncharacterized secreted protein with C-terminal beta-propeller domain
MKKFLALLLLLAVVVASFAACSAAELQAPEAENASGDLLADFSAIPPIREEDLRETVEVSAYIAGRAFDVANRDNGAGSVLNIAKNTNKEEFLGYVAELEEKGFAKYTGNKIGNNLFVTNFLKQ